MEKYLHLVANLAAKISHLIGRGISWLTVTMVLLLAGNVLSSWLFNQSAILVTESVTWMHAANFLLAAAYTLNQNEHVRVDIFYSRMSPKSKCWVDLIGTLLFLIPVCLFILWASWSFVLLSFNVKEVSAEAGGLPALWILKSFLLVMPLLLTIEAVGQITKNIARIVFPPEASEINQQTAALNPAGKRQLDTQQQAQQQKQEKTNPQGDTQ